MLGTPSQADFETAPLTVTDFVRYAGAAGDFNPVHHDAAFAQANGYDQPFAMGMFTAAVTSQVLARRVGLANVRDYSVRFLKPVWPAERLVISAEPASAEQTKEFKLAVGSSAGEPKIAGHATVGDASEHAPPAPPSEGPVRDFRMVLERGKIAEFARASLDRSSIYFDLASAKAAGFEDIPAPLLFLNTAQFHLGDDWYLGGHAGIPIERCVHGESRWRFYRALQAGERLRGVTHIADEVRRPSSKGGELRFVTFHTTFFDQQEDIVQVEDMVVVELPDITRQDSRS